MDFLTACVRRGLGHIRDPFKHDDGNLCQNSSQRQFKAINYTHKKAHFLNLNRDGSQKATKDAIILIVLIILFTGIIQEFCLHCINKFII